jgi:hypothetical protein
MYFRIDCPEHGECADNDCQAGARGEDIQVLSEEELEELAAWLDRQYNQEEGQT